MWYERIATSDQRRRKQLEIRNEKLTSILNRQPSTVNHQPSTVNIQSQIVNRQSSIANLPRSLACTELCRSVASPLPIRYAWKPIGRRVILERYTAIPMRQGPEPIRWRGGPIGKRPEPICRILTPIGWGLKPIVQRFSKVRFPRVRLFISKNGLWNCHSLSTEKRI